MTRRATGKQAFWSALLVVILVAIGLAMLSNWLWPPASPQWFLPVP